jgi:hypothetical protein
MPSRLDGPPSIAYRIWSPRNAEAASIGARPKLMSNAYGQPTSRPYSSRLCNIKLAAGQTLFRQSR